MKFRKRKKQKPVMSLDEIFLDAENIPAFDRYQFEVRMEKPLASRPFYVVAASFLFVLVLLGARAGYLQIIKGADYSRRSEENHLRFVSLLPERGMIYDRNGELLAGNSFSFLLVLDKEKI